MPSYSRPYGSLDKALGHYRRYTRSQLAAVAARAGFHVREILHFNRAGVLGWWLNGKLLSRETFSLAQMKLLNMLTPFPPHRPMDAFAFAFSHRHS